MQLRGKAKFSAMTDCRRAAAPEVDAQFDELFELLDAYAKREMASDRTFDAEVKRCRSAASRVLTRMLGRQAAKHEISRLIDRVC